MPYIHVVLCSVSYCYTLCEIQHNEYVRCTTCGCDLSNTLCSYHASCTTYTEFETLLQNNTPLPKVIQHMILRYTLVSSTLDARIRHFRRLAIQEFQRYTDYADGQHLKVHILIPSEILVFKKKDNSYSLYSKHPPESCSIFKEPRNTS